MSTRKVKKMKKLLIMIALLAMCILPLDAGAVEMTWTWDPPVTGSPVVHYMVEQSISGGDWAAIGTAPTENWTGDFPVNVDVQVRVAGIDAAGHQGVWSIASDPEQYTVPGQPGQPSCAGCGNE